MCLGGPLGNPSGCLRAAPVPNAARPAARTHHMRRAVGSGRESAYRALPAVCPCAVLPGCCREIGVLLPSTIESPALIGQNPARWRRRGGKMPRKTGAELALQAVQPRQSDTSAKINGRRTPIPRQYLPASPRAHSLWPILPAALPRSLPQDLACACTRGPRRLCKRERIRGFIPPSPWQGYRNTPLQLRHGAQRRPPHATPLAAHGGSTSHPHSAAHLKYTYLPGISMSSYHRRDEPCRILSHRQRVAVGRRGGLLCASAGAVGASGRTGPQTRGTRRKGQRNGQHLPP